MFVGELPMVSWAIRRDPYGRIADDHVIILPLFCSPHFCASGGPRPGSSHLARTARTGPNRGDLRRSDVDDGDPLGLGLTGFLDQPGQVIRVAGEQYDGAFEAKRGSCHHGVNGTPMAR
jgi:hypothetical protein